MSRNTKTGRVTIRLEDGTVLHTHTVQARKRLMGDELAEKIHRAIALRIIKAELDEMDKMLSGRDKAKLAGVTWKAKP